MENSLDNYELAYMYALALGYDPQKHGRNIQAGRNATSLTVREDPETVSTGMYSSSGSQARHPCHNV
jgi:hypothetical protein